MLPQKQTAERINQKSDNSIKKDRSGAPPYKQNAAQQRDPPQKQSLMDLNSNS
jgi:hypothetical protein